MGLLDVLIGKRGGGMSPIAGAVLGLLAYKAMKGKNLSEIFGGSAAGSGGLGGLMQGGLGGLLGGAGSIVSGGLNDLLRQFQINGEGDKAASWVSTEPNKPITPRELEQALGEERIGWLMQQTGLSRSKLLAGLSQELPEAVDNLTPHGRIPNEEEARRLVA
jgi:uncharacterized protein YidB (DUF937 family)